ncbi:hypothetical protein HAX54_003379 [Datura stramonium]|uniref:Secreted protein n=1 Tax=Datura stramonium TaxID=4076 RepID=A0ABS8WX30_DATST|nr:hypothetical protein [Datura stramonium]
MLHKFVLILVVLCNCKKRKHEGVILLRELLKEKLVSILKASYGVLFPAKLHKIVFPFFALSRCYLGDNYHLSLRKVYMSSTRGCFIVSPTFLFVLSLIG